MCSSRGVIVAMDVDYRERHAVVARVAFHAWTDASPAFERIVRVEGEPADYEPGKFYLRELPCLLAALHALRNAPDVCVVDGYVSLGATKKGLGAHLFDALAASASRVAVVGVAKNAFRGATAERVARGASKKPLYVTSLGMPPKDAAHAVRSMHGDYRVPTLLQRADRLCRSSLNTT